MKKRYTYHGGLTVFFAFAVSVCALPQWQCLGLDTHIVNCITVDDQGNVIAGTNSGMQVYYNKTWYKVPVSIATKDLLVTGPTRVMAACGGEFDSAGGLYEANVTMSAPPFYSLRLVGVTHYPTALAKTNNSDVVYTGTGGSVTRSYLDTAGGGYFSFTNIPIPPYSFGVEAPYCAALHVSVNEKTLFAGGYDRSPMPGPGHLLRMSQDSLPTFAQLNVSAIAEGILDLKGMKLFVGTTDTGIFYRSIEMSAPLQKHSESPNNEKVNDIIVLPMAINAGHLVAAVAGGVYYQTPASWQELGDIPATPNCLTFGPGSTTFEDSRLYAGTDKGVYVLDSMVVAITDQTQKKSHPVKNVQVIGSGGVVSIACMLQKPGKTYVDIIDCTGRAVATLHFADGTIGRNLFSIDMNSINGRKVSNGVYILRIVINETPLYKKVMITR